MADMTSMNISLPESMKKFIETEVERGGYGTASEYVRELVRAAQERRTTRSLEELLLEGINSGEAKEMTPADWDRLRRIARERHQKRKRA